MKKKQVWNHITSILLALFLCIAFILPASASGLIAQAQSPEEILAAMTTEEKVAQMLIPPRRKGSRNWANTSRRFPG